jgi:U4/U6.U5 tri-snRNP-associated protein 3
VPHHPPPFAPPPPPPLPPLPVEEAAGGGEEEDDEEAMRRLMGFSGFDSTKGKEVEDANANASAVFKKSVRSARQYMNRKGGFNRPLPQELTGQTQNRT